MAFENITQSFASLSQGLTLAEGWVALRPLIFFVIAMVVYSIFVFKFYRFIARRDVFRLSEGGKGSVLARIGYFFEYIFLFPVITFIWFLVISTLLSMLSTVVQIDNIFFVSMAMLATIRVCAYYNEELSKDVAKLIPFALLAILLIDMTDISTQAPLQVLDQIPGMFEILIYYFIFIVFLEFVLRIIFHELRKPKEK